MGSKRYSNKGYNAAKREEAVKDQQKSSTLFTVVCAIVVGLIAVGVIVLAIVFGGGDGKVVDHGDHTHIEGVEDTIHDAETTAGVVDHGDHTHAAGEEIDH